MDPTLPNATDLDPAGAADVDEIRRLFEGATVEQVQDEAFLAAVAEKSPCALLRDEARLMLGMVVQKRGDLAATVQHFTQGLRSAWGSGSSIECRAVINYSIICINQKRPLEAMLLARRGRSLAAHDQFLHAASTLNLAGALMCLGRQERAAELIRSVDEMVDELEGYGRVYIDIVRHSYGIAAECERGDGAAARARLEYLESMDETGLGALTMPCFRARVAFASGELESTLRVLEHVRAVDAPWDGAIAAAELLEIRALLRLDQRESAIARASTLIDRLEDPMSDCIDAGDRLESARLLAEEVGDHPDSAHIARRALAVAAAAAIERICQADCFRRELPGFEFLTGEDRRVLDEYHEQFTTDYGDVLDHVSLLLASSENFAAVRASDTATPFIAVCSWCRRIRGPQGLWVDVGELDPPDGTVRVTHGACEPCFEETVASFGSAVAS
jgi:ATP/maltotriose-dependent transcriptional regulator MalT